MAIPRRNNLTLLFTTVITLVMTPLYYSVLHPSGLEQHQAFARCPNGTHKSPSGVCEQVVPHEGLPRCPNGFHRSPSGICEAVNGGSNSENSNKNNNIAGNNNNNFSGAPVEPPASNNPSSSSPGQFKVYCEQYGRFSIQVPKDWTIGSPQIKQESVVILFDSNNADEVEFTVAASDRHTMISGTDWQQVIQQDNLDLVARTPGATLTQPTECTKYVIDGNAACSMTYTTTNNGYTQEEMDIDFQTGKQEVLITITGSADIFDKYMPIIEQMLNSMKVS